MIDPHRGWQGSPGPATGSPQPMAGGAITAIKLQVGVFAMSLVMMAAVVVMIGQESGAASASTAGGPLVLVLVMGLLGRLIGHRAPPRGGIGHRAPPRGGTGRRQPVAQLSRRLLTAAAVAEAGGLLVLMFSFVTPLYLPAVLVAMVLSAVMVLLAAWPSASLLKTWEQQLTGSGRQGALA